MRSHPFKSDIRLYVLVTCWHPLTVYLFEDGLARFATEPYSNEAIDRRCMHLTNYSLNKHAKGFVKNTDAEQDGVGTKWSLAAFKKRLEAQFGPEKAKQARHSRPRINDRTLGCYARLSHPAV